MKTPGGHYPSDERADALTFGELWLLFPSLAGFLSGRRLSPEEAEDMAQETLFSAWKNRSGFRGEAKLSTWVFGIAKMKILQWHRDQRRLKRERIEIGLAEQAGEEATGVVLRAGGPGAEEQLLAKEDLRVVREAMSSLPPLEREALLLLVDQGRSYREIAAILRCEVNQVTAWIYQARQKLRRALEDATAAREVKHD